MTCCVRGSGFHPLWCLEAQRKGMVIIMCKVSIIIPYYNVELELIHRCLASIESQTFFDYEVIVVDDGSAQNFSEVLCEMKNQYPKISVVYQENKGVSAARNFGLEKSQGEYVLFVDADDYLTPLFLEEALSTAEKHAADIVMGMNMTTYTTDYEQLMGNEQPTVLRSEKISVFQNEDIYTLKKWMLGRAPYQSNNAYLGQGPWNRLVRRSLAVKTPFDETLPIGEDIVWNLQLLQKAGKVCIVDRVWYIYYMNPTSSSRKYRENAIKESYDSLRKMREYLDIEDDEQYLSYCYRCWSDLKRIYLCYLSYNSKEKLQQKRYLFTSDPWHELSSKRFKRLCNYKYQLMRVLYKSRLLFDYYHIKTKLINDKVM